MAASEHHILLSSSEGSSLEEEDGEKEKTNNSTQKSVRFVGKGARTSSNFTVSDPDDSDEILNHDRSEQHGSEILSKNRISSDVDEKPFIIGGKALRGTKARRKYSEDYSDFEDDYGANIYQPRLRNRPQVNYSKQLMPANFTQILENESKVLDRKIEATERYNEDRKSSNDRFSLSSRFRPSNPTKGKSTRMHERLNESSDDDVPVLKKGRIFGLLQASSMQSSKNQILPVNMQEMMRAEELRLLKRVDENSRDLFMGRIYGNESNLYGSIGQIGFNDVSGFDDHIMSLKEMVGLPLMYPDIFAKFSINAPKGVLFHGPPGTGKTMMARALANSCSAAGRPVAFFMRKGADILSKWVGESERQLRLLFEQAKAWQPSIIFFDEIDGLAPVRSSKQDQIHASVVSTLLSLMDGLDNRGQVVVIGATNRIDSIDPALRRPGRFDREFFFGLPKEDARRKIIHISTKDWNPPLTSEELNSLAVMTRGYNGADVKALCTEAALHAVRRTYPQIYNGCEKYKINLDSIQVVLEDFIECMTKLSPSTERSSFSFGRSLPQHLAPLLKVSFEKISSWVHSVIPLLKQTQRIKPAPSLDDPHASSSNPLWIQDYLKSFAPRLAIYGPASMGQDLLGASVVEILEQGGFYVRSIDISSLISSDTTTDALILSAFCELKRHRQSALYLPNIHAWWDGASDATKEVFISLLKQTRHASLLVVMTMEWSLDEIPQEVSSFFPSIRSGDFTGHSKRFGDWKVAFPLSSPDESCRERFFANLIEDFIRPTKRVTSTAASVPLAFEVVEDGDKDVSEPLFDSAQLQDLLMEYESHKRKLRQVFSAILEDLRKGYRIFTKPLDIHLFPDYEPVEHVDLMIMEDRVHSNRYDLPDGFLRDIELIKTNVLEGTNARIPSHRDVIAKARKLVDSATENVQLLTQEFIQQCWYFFLFKKSGMLPSSVTRTEEVDGVGEDDKKHHSSADTISIASDDRDPIFKGEEDNSTIKETSLLGESTPVSPVFTDEPIQFSPVRQPMARNPFHDDDMSLDVFGEPIQPAVRTGSDFSASDIRPIPPRPEISIPEDLDNEDKCAFISFAVSRTNGYTLLELEDVAAVLATTCINSGELNLTRLISLFPTNLC